MPNPTSHRVLVGLAATCLAGGIAASVVGSGAAATTADSEGTTEHPPSHAGGHRTSWADNLAALGLTSKDVDRLLSTAPGEGVASMAAPYIPGVPHVPAGTLLALSPDGPRYVGREGSLFNGPADQVEQRVERWWAAQLAAGVSPEEADRRLADLAR